MGLPTTCLFLVAEEPAWHRRCAHGIPPFVQNKTWPEVEGDDIESFDTYSEIEPALYDSQRKSYIEIRKKVKLHTG